MQFQTILLAIFGIVAVIGVAVFAIAKPESKQTELAGARGNAVIWGTYPVTKELKIVFENFNKKYQDSFSVSYSYHDPAKFDTEIVEALASNKGPDILMLPDDLILRHEDKIQLIPYTSYPPRDFSSTFVQAAEIYLRPTGIVSLPFSIDPMVMYWNRDIFNNSSVTQPPKYWDEFLVLAPKLTKRDIKTSDILQSAISFGEYDNVTHAKDVLAMLFLQVGNPIVAASEKRGPVSMLSSLDDTGSLVPDQDVVSALRFFMDFSNPLKNVYSWSRAQPASRDDFIAGNLAVYFDYASAYKTMALKNPHLNFSVAPVPQLRETSAEITYAKIHGLVVLKNSKNSQTAFTAVRLLLSDKEPSRDFAIAFDLPPVRRDMLSVRPTDAALSVFYDSAIRARTWLDPRPEESSKFFRAMIDSISSGKNNAGVALQRLDQDITSLLPRQ